MTRCPDSGTLQDSLEGLLRGDEAESVRAHAATCARCTAELARLGRVFRVLEAIPLEAPSPALADRVLELVLPARQRVRWLRRLGVGYGAALAACLTGLAVWVTQPSGHMFLAWLAGEAPARLFHSLLFVMNGITFLALYLSGGWTLVTQAGAHISPLARALIAVADHGLIQIALALSALLWLAALWWLQARPGRSGKGTSHVGVLAF